MGKVYPDIETIGRKHQAPTEGEMALLTALQDNLPNDFQIFFQPYLNGDRPDIVILRKEYGIHIIEVKDWNLDCYNVDSDGRWSVKNSNVSIKSPFSQVQSYKENMYNLHVDGLLEKKIRNSKLFGIVTCSIYFHKASSQEIMDKINCINVEQTNKVANEIKFTRLYGRELLDKSHVNEFIYNSILNRKSILFSNELYDNMLRLLNPPFHYLEEGTETEYSKEQLILIQNTDIKRRKIRGVAGCGKTLVLAQRAVNAYKRTQSKVLILTYNITLINYIHDLISNVRESFPWSAFEILNYHEFFNSKANRYMCDVYSLDEYQTIDFFDNSRSKIIKYNTILIDEAQDYKEEWFRIITKYFLADNGEFIVFADEKQNIYDNELDEDKKVKVPTITGKWNESLKKPFRCSRSITNMLSAFQHDVFKSKYELDDFELEQQTFIDDGSSSIDYKLIEANSSPNIIFNIIKEYVRNKGLHPSDVTVLNSKVKLLREIDYLIRKNGEKTTTTFETKEFIGKLCEEYQDMNRVNATIESIRKNKKRHFMMKTGTIKLSTIHSFKGWEIHTAIILIEHEDQQSNFESAELVYTGLSRARFNILVINIGNDMYHNSMENLMREAL